MDVPFPRGRSAQVLPFLAHHGIVPVVPSIRSSDYELALADPFVYYLVRRLGLSSLLWYSEALSHGSWYHVAAEHDDFVLSDQELLAWVREENLPPGFRATYELRRAELGRACDELGISGDTRRELADRLLKDTRTGLAFYAGSAQVVIPGEFKQTWRSFLMQPQWRILAREFPIAWDDSVCRLDLLLFQEDSRALWIVDFKTTSLPPSLRLSTCVLEFQSQHYLHGLRQNLPSLIFKFGLPPDTVVGGIMHIAIQKPQIRLSREDRDFELVDVTPTRGPNKGVTRQEKRYFGEPRVHNFLSRVVDWYTSQGLYLHTAPETAAEPRVNIGFTPISSVLDEHGLFQYSKRLEVIQELRLREPAPENFPTNPSSLRGKGKEPSPFLLFATRPVDEWPDIMNKKGIVVRHRDLEPENGEEEGQEEDH